MQLFARSCGLRLQRLQTAKPNVHYNVWHVQKSYETPLSELNFAIILAISLTPPPLRREFSVLGCFSLE